MANRSETSNNEDILKAYGVPVNALHAPSFDIRQRVKEINYVSFDKQYKRSISTKKQLQFYKETMENTLDKNYIYCISSDLNSLKAQYIVLTIFLQAIDQYVKSHDPYYNEPKWTYITGGIKDELRHNRDRYKPNLLVIDGLAVNSTDYKVEKARDIIEMYSDVPRIIITCGTCPIKFMYERLYIPTNKVMYLSETKSVEL